MLTNMKTFLTNNAEKDDWRDLDWAQWGRFMRITPADVNAYYFIFIYSLFSFLQLVGKVYQELFNMPKFKKIDIKKNIQ